MRRHLFLAASVGLNAVLAAVLLSPGHRSPPAQAEAATNAPTAGTNDTKPKVVARRQFFSWEELESPDYPVYIARLREIGCPEQTIRDIVIADVNQLYAKKMDAEVVTPDQQWWRSTLDTNMVATASAKTEVLEQEKRRLLATLLGPNWDSGDPTRSIIALNGPVLGGLSPEAKHTVEDIVARAGQQTQAYLAAQQANGAAPDPVELARIRQATRKELAQALTPEQLEEFLLRYSDTAIDMRKQLQGVSLTPEEFRSLFRARDPLFQQMELAGGNDPASTAERSTLSKQLDDTLKNALGKDRYQAYQISFDPAYSNAVAFAKQIGAPASAIQDIYDLNKAVTNEQNRIRNDDSLTPEQKAAQLQAVDQQLQAAKDQLSGAGTTAPPEIMPPGLAPTQTHAYSPGETIDQIAAQYGVSPISILNANPALDINRLQKGTPIKIPQQ